MSITKSDALPIERFVLQICIKYQVIALKTLMWFQAWSEDVKQAYWERASEMYSLVESVIVNSAMPNKYQMKLVSKQEFEKEAEVNQYA